MDILMAEEWIGLEIRIISSPNPKLIGIEGKIVHEGANSITLLTPNSQRKIVPKKGVQALVIASGKILKLSCASMRPEDRSKKLYKKIFAKG